MLAPAVTARTCVAITADLLHYEPDERTFYGHWGHFVADGFDAATTRVLMVESRRTGQVERFDRMPGAEGERERVYASRRGLVVVLHVCEW